MSMSILYSELSLMLFSPQRPYVLLGTGSLERQLPLSQSARALRHLEFSVALRPQRLYALLGTSISTFTHFLSSNG